MSSAPTLDRQGRFNAENLHRMGLFPFPLHAPDPTDPKAFKRPACAGWQALALRSTADQRAAWDKSGCNLGLYLAPSRLVVLDSDTDEAEAWAVANTSETPWIVRTSKGRHRYYRLAPGAAAPVDNRPIPGLDVKASGFVVALGSFHHAARIPYQAEGDWDAPLSDLPIFSPAWFPRREARVWQARREPSSPAHGPDVRTRAAHYLQALPPAVQGQDGHGTLLRACLKTLVNFKELSGEEIENLLWEIFNPRCTPPWSESERADFARKVREAQRILGLRVCA